MAVPKKRTSISKKRIRKTFWKIGGYWIGLKSFSLAKSISTGNSKSFFLLMFTKKYSILIDSYFFFFNSI
ncbi:hypothetical protein RIF29_43267 [Crotalaria pallida]|uniref:Large ribosomal subunit protein bL32c n=1 Tax=Crotalaria pallida TaxID=3830 RepID=A0AAN9E011_CROPI